MTGNEIVAYKYDGIIHCVSCARKRFGRRLNLKDLTDRDDIAVQPITAADDEYQGLYCDECAEPLGE